MKSCAVNHVFDLESTRILVCLCSCRSQKLVTSPMSAFNTVPMQNLHDLKTLFPHGGHILLGPTYIQNNQYQVIRSNDVQNNFEIDRYR